MPERRDMFAIDGVKPPSHASKQRSGTRADFQRQAERLEAAANTMLARHRADGDAPREAGVEAKNLVAEARSLMARRC